MHAVFGIVKDNARGVALTGTDTTHAMAHSDAAYPVGAALHGEYACIALFTSAGDTTRDAILQLHPLADNGNTGIRPCRNPVLP